MKCLFALLIFLKTSDLLGQSISVSTALTPQQLVNNVLLGFGINAYNITINGSASLAQSSIGNVAQFTNTNPGFPFNNGLLLTTGNVSAACGPNNTENATSNLPPTTLVDFDVTIDYMTNNIVNGVVLEFDFISSGDIFEFKYIFGSEEYPEWSPSSFNDAFGFILGGPGISGPYPLPGYPNGGINIAALPNGTPITINNVGPAFNQAFYVNNAAGLAYNNAIQYDGTTTLLTASAVLQCNQPYHIKLFIANIGDDAWDSGVFFKAGSFSSSAPADLSIATTSNDTTIVEGCTEATIFFTRPQGQINDTLLLNYTIGGSAQQGVDYNTLVNPITFLPGQDSVILNITPILDNVSEGCESIDLSISFINPCGDSVTLLQSIWICDAPILDIASNNPTIYCAVDSVWLAASASGGYAPYDYSWQNLVGTPLGTNDSISVGISQNGTMYYLVTATDNCNFTKTDTVTVNLNQTLAIDTIIFESASCMPTGFVSVQASGFQGTPAYFWSGPGPNGYIQAPTWTDLPTGMYYIEITDSLCAINDSIYVNSLPTADAQFSADILSGCAPLEVSFTNTSQNANFYSWDFGDGQVANSTNLTVQNHIFNGAPGVYSVELIAYQSPNCFEATSLMIQIEICGCTDPLAINYDPNAVTDDGSCVYSVGCTDPLAINYDPNAIIEDGSCEYAHPEVFAPNVFTPNLDNNNEAFFLSTKNVTTLQLTILNRWGNVVFERSSVDLINNNPSWDGTIDGQLATEGIYFYTYVATGINGQEVKGHGFMHLANKK
jgi:gliding motility-associated-like protein